MMLTRKQRWRRIQHQRSFVEPSAPAPATRLNIDGCMGATSPRPPCRPHPFDALSVGDSLRQLVRSSTPSSSSSCTPPPPPAPPVEDTPATKSVCFHHQVRVILVPCRRELRALQLQLWWGADDYQHFRREYVMLLRMAAQKHHDDIMQQQQQQQQRQRSSSTPPADTQLAAATGIATAGSPPGVTATDAGAQPAAAAGERPARSLRRVSTIPEITPPRPCIVKVSEISPTAAAATAIDGSGGERRGDVTAADDGAQQARAAAPGVILVATAISPAALSAAAAAAAVSEGAPVNDCSKPTNQAPRPRVHVKGVAKWTPSAGARAAAAAAAEAEFEDYRTSSMSSASDGYYADDRDSTDGDHDGDDLDDRESGEDAAQSPLAGEQRLGFHRDNLSPRLRATPCS